MYSMPIYGGNNEVENPGVPAIGANNIIEPGAAANGAVVPVPVPVAAARLNRRHNNNQPGAPRGVHANNMIVQPGAEINPGAPLRGGGRHKKRRTKHRKTKSRKHRATKSRKHRR